MKIEIRGGNRNQQIQGRKLIYLNSEAVLRYLLGTDEKIETMVMCREPAIGLTTTDRDIYEALASLKPDDDFKINRLTKFFENVDVKSFREITGSEKPVLTFEKAEELRKSALKQK
ncbi:hypothetical protein HYT54_02125 [Candidatus Woesearchaeota archaeon]|nr:hypothetical protein [Candidatus Woesearchaeota archaeon]